MMKWITGWRIWGILGGILAVIFGVLTIEKNHYKRKAESLEEEIQANDVMNEVKNFEAINRERAQQVERSDDVTHSGTDSYDVVI